LLSYYTNVPTGPAIILVSGVGYILSMLVGPRGGLVWQVVHRKHLEA
jgi:zinc/manganese transport system permease protein